MTSKLTRERLEQLAENNTICKVSWDERIELAQIALAAMDSESGCLPLDYLQGHKDGLEWAAQLAEANHPETGDWLYDDPIELAKAIRKGPDMPPAQPAADSEPVAWTWHYREQWHVTNDKRRAEFVAKDGDVAVLPLYRHAQPAPLVPDEMLCEFYEVDSWPDLVRELVKHVEQLQDSAKRNVKPWEDTFPETLLPVYIEKVKQADEACRAAMLAAAPQSPGSEPATVPGTWIPVSERMPEAGGDMIVFTDGIVMSGVSYAKKKGFYIQALEYDDDEPVDSVTHWMPLPAAPKEVR